MFYKFIKRNLRHIFLFYLRSCFRKVCILQVSRVWTIFSFNLTNRHYMRYFCFKSCLLVCLTGLFFACSQQTVAAQDTCKAITNKFLSSGYFIENTTCGVVNGRINLFMPIDPSLYTFEWSPNVSDNNLAENLSAGFYHIKISLDSIPACVLDTFFFVNNSDGPNFNVNLDTANCKAKDGAIVLVPADPNAQLVYQWQDGPTGSTLNQIAAGAYIVQVTDTVSGCFSIKRILLPSKNPLLSNTYVVSFPKCGKPIGKVGVNVTGGSGDYLYNGSTSPVYEDLNAGSYKFIITDQLTQCKDTVSVSLIDQPVSGDLTLTPHSVTCPANASNVVNNVGYVEIQVQPNANFRMPFTYNILNGNGLQFQPDSLPGGLYEVQISDADGCNLPIKTFFINQPGNFTLFPLPDIQPETNLQLGSITLNINGGTGGYRFDWDDLPGTNDPINRLNLNAGLYEVTVYDAENCKFPIGPLAIAAQNPKIDSIYLFVKQGAIERFCPTAPVGVGPNGATYASLNGFLTGSSLQGSWVLDSINGCLNYNATGTAGGPKDVIFIRQTVSNNALSRTYAVVVTITSIPPSFENVYFSLPVSNSGTFCGNIPPGLTNFNIVPVAANGLNGTLGQFGAYQINPSNGCINFQSAGITGYNVDKICIGLYAPALNRSHIICYWPSIQPANGCLNDLIPYDTTTITIDNCTEPAQVCLDIPYDQLNQYAIIDNGQNYTGGDFPCGFDTVQVIYKAANWPLVGPYILDNWQIGAQQLTGTFQNFSGLVSLMNQLDPGAGWEINNNFQISGGNPAKTYGPVSIKNTLGTVYQLNPASKIVAQKSVLKLNVGVHNLRIYNKVTACTDSLKVTVVCSDCPTFVSYLPDSLGLVTVTADACDEQFLLCTNFFITQVLQFEIKRNQVATVSSDFSSCGNLTALLLDTGLQQVSIRELSTNCTQNLKVRVNCTPPGVGDLKANPDNYVSPLSTDIAMPILENDIIFGILANEPGLLSVEVLDAPKLGGVTYFADEGIFRYYPENGCGVDTFTYALRDTIGRESIAQVSVRMYCENLFVFNGISPNGDNLNDVWHIIGIEDFPTNEVSVFNRWGSLVYKQRGYTNSNAWDGQSNEKALPDGTYFYLIELGNGDPAVKGYLQIMR